MTELDTRPTSARRSRKKAFWAAAAVVVVIGVAVGLALFQPWRLFTRSTVDEALPVAVAAETGTPSEQPVSAAPLTVTPTNAPGPASGAPVPATVSAIEPPAPAPAEPVVLASGDFVDGEHATSGTASILRLQDGSTFVRLEGFSTSDGPDVHVWLTDQPAGASDWGVYDDGRFLELGELKGTDGNQNYPIPADADISGLTSVVIWCDRFNVAFGSAPVAG